MNKLYHNKKLIEELDKLQEFNTPTISDALDACGVEGALFKIKALTPCTKLIGPAYTVQFKLNNKKPLEQGLQKALLPFSPGLSEGCSTHPSEQEDTNVEEVPTVNVYKNAANYIDSVPAGAVLVIDNEGRNECSSWGEILTQVAIQKNILGTVVHGAIRDVEFIRQSKYPVYCTDVCMRSGKNRIHKVNEQTPLVVNSVTINPGDIIFADDNGALVIPRALVSDIINKAQNIKKNESNISKAIKSGSSLEQARIDHRYDQPWLDIKHE